MMAFFTVEKDPHAKLDYGIDWADPNAEGGPWLASGETIVASTWAIYQDDMTTAATDITIVSNSHDTTHTIVWLAGGTRDATRYATNHIVTSQGREDDRSIKIRLKEK